MTKASDVLIMLLPEGGWATHGDNFEDITFIEAEPLTKEQFNAGAAKYEAWKAEAEAKAAADKAALLAKLGITADEAKLLLS
jgi:hypothetical protein